MDQNFNVPILFIIFNKPDVTQLVFDKIKEAKPSKLFIAADGARKDKDGEKEKCQEARNIVKQIDWNCEVQTLFQEKNLGCKIGVSSAINWFFSNVEEGIILEDDCLPHFSFFEFCKNLLEKYRNDTRVMMIAGSNFQEGNRYGDGDYYFSKFAHIWGWASWKRAWNLYDVNANNFPNFLEQNKIDEVVVNDEKLRHQWIRNIQNIRKGKIDTWDYQWSYAIFSNHGLSATPNVNLISNIGFGHSGATHTKGVDSKLSNLPTRELKNISHPTFILPSRPADDFISKNILFKESEADFTKKKKRRLFSNLKKIAKKLTKFGKKTKHSKVSVITVCKNTQDFLETTIKSVLNQTAFDNIEYIIVDGGSTDGTAEIVKKYRNKIAVFVSEPDHGIYNAMNKGLKMAGGDIIYFLNSGDSFYDNYVVEKIISKFNENKSDMIYGNVDTINYATNQKEQQIYGQIDKMYFYGSCFVQQAIFYKASCFKKCGLFDESFRISGDYDWISRALTKHKLKMKYFKDFVCLFRMGGVSNSGELEQLHGEENAKIRKYFSKKDRFFYKKLRRKPFFFFKSFDEMEKLNLKKVILFKILGWKIW